MCELLGCTPSELDEQDVETLELFWHILNVRAEEAALDGRRAKQRKKR